MENSMQTREYIYCAIDTPEGVLMPRPNGAVKVTLEKIDNEDGEGLSGRLRWDNSVKAFLTYDLSGTQIIGFIITDMSEHAAITEQSVINILSVI